MVEGRENLHVVSFMRAIEDFPEYLLDEARWLGIFSTARKAKEAVTFYLSLKEYSGYSEENFYISECKLNEKQWLEGTCECENEEE